MHKRSFILILTLTTLPCFAQQPTLRLIDTINPFAERFGTAPERYRNFRGLLIEEDSVTEYKPMPTVIYFDSASATIPKRYIQYVADEEVWKFDEQMAGEETLDIQYHILNLIGYRLTKNPKLKLTILGYHSKQIALGESRSIAVKRAQAVYNYLTNTWRIEGKRITLVSQPEFRGSICTPRDPLIIAMERRVEVTFTAGTDSTRSALMVRAGSRYSLYPATVFVPSCRFADADLAERYLQISINNITRMRIPVLGWKPPMYRNKWLSGIPLSDPSIPDSGTCSIQLVVVLKNGTVLRSPLLDMPYIFLSRRHRTENLHLDRAISIYSYTGFLNLDHLEPPAYVNQQLQQYIFPIICKTSHIEVVSRTDITGLDDRNLIVSQRRSNYIESCIKKSLRSYASLSNRGLGESDPLFDNLTPEGRFYNGSVQVVVETVVR